MRQLRYWLPALVTTLALGAVVAAQDDGVLLRHQRAEGEKWTRNSNSQLTLVVQSPDGIAEGTMSTEAVQNYRVETAANGSYTIARRGNSVTRIQGIPNAPEEEKREQQPATFEQSTSGKPGPVSFPAYEADPANPVDIGGWIAYTLEQMPPLEVFPEEKVFVGEEWTSEHKLKQPDGKEATVKLTYRLVAYDSAAGKAYITQDMTATLDMKLGDDNLKVSFNTTFANHMLNTFDAKAGKVLRGVGNGRLTTLTELDIMGQQVQINMHAVSQDTFTQQ